VLNLQSGLRHRWSNGRSTAYCLLLGFKSRLSRMSW